MCIKDYETEIEGQGPVRAVEPLGKKNPHISASPEMDIIPDIGLHIWRSVLSCL
jgi:hypothetical protein